MIEGLSRKLQVILMIVFFFCSQGSAQVPHYNLKTFSSAENFGGAISTIYQDHNGFIWIGSDFGLFKYDGKTFRPLQVTATYALPSSNVGVSSLAEDSQGYLWVLSDPYGIFIINTANDSVTGFIQHNKNSPQHSLINNHTNSVLRTSSNEMWVSGCGGISIFAPGNRVSSNNILLPFGTITNPVNCSYQATFLKEDKRGNIWVGTIGDGIWIINGKTKKLTRHIKAEAIAKKGIPLRIREIYPANDTTVWVCTDAGLWQIVADIHTGSFRIEEVPVMSNNKEISDLAITGMLKQPNGYWLFTNGMGIIHGNFNTGKQPTKSFFGVNHIYKEYREADHPYQDREGGIWVNLHFRGNRALGYYHPVLQRFSRLTAGDGITQKKIPSVEAIYTDDHINFLLGTSDGLFLYNDSTGLYSEVLAADTKYNQQKRAGNIVDIYKDTDRELYCLTQQNVKRIVKRNNRYILAGLSNHPEWKELESLPFYQMVPFADSLLFFIGNNGEGNKDLYIWNRKKHKTVRYSSHNLSADGTKNLLINYMFTDARNNIWMGTNAGLSRFDLVKRTLIPCRPGGVALPPIYIIQGYGRYLWLAPYNGGCFRFDPDNNQIRHYGEKEGLNGTSITAILPDSIGNIWMSTEKGISCFDTARGVFRNYSNAESLSDNSVFMYSGFAKDGLLYFGSIGGVTRINSAAFAFNQYAAPLAYTEIEVTATDGQRTKLHVQADGSVAVMPNQKIIKIDFALLSYADPARSEYTYRLEGLQNNWIPLGHQSSVTFTGLPPGNYRLHIKARNNDGTANKKDALLLLKVVPRYWQTLWFKLITAAIGILVLFSLIRLYYLARLRKQRVAHEKQLAVHRERKRISRDMHDDLGSSLTSIQLQVDGVRMSLAKEKEEDDELKNVSHSVKQMIVNMREIIWALNPEDDNLESTLLFIRKYFLSTMETAVISSAVNYPEQFPELELPGMLRRNLFLGVKEAVNNIIKHAGATQASLSVVVSGNKLKLIIEDNGRGNSSGDNRFSNGLKNMQKRMELIDATCEVRFSPQGTTVIFGIYS